MRRGFTRLVLVCSIAATGAALEAQQIRIRSGPYTAVPGETISLPIELETTTDVTGFSFGVVHDSQDLDLVEVTTAPALAAVADTTSDFFLIDDSLPSGFIVAVIIHPRETSGVLRSGTHQLFDATYRADSSATGTTSVAISGGLGDNPVVDLIIDVNGGVARPFAGSSVSVSFTAAFRRGDVNANGNFELTDAIAILRYLFQSGALGTCPIALNVDGSTAQGAESLTEIRLNDAIVLLNWIFLGGASPADPFLECGHSTNPLQANVVCQQYAGC